MIFDHKKVILPNFTNFYILANIFFGVGMLYDCTDTFHRKEGGIQVLAGLS